MSWNSYPSYMIHSIIKQLQRKHENKVHEIADDSTNKEMIKIWIRLPYLGKEGEVIVKSLLKKLKRYVKSNVKFVTLYQTKKSAMFCSSKDPVPTEQNKSPKSFIKSFVLGVSKCTLGKLIVVSRIE